MTRKKSYILHGSRKKSLDATVAYNGLPVYIMNG